MTPPGSQWPFAPTVTRAQSFFFHGIVLQYKKDLVLFGGMAVFFYAVGAPVKGTFMAVFTLAMGVLFVYGLRKDPKPARRTWNSWFAKRR